MNSASSRTVQYGGGREALLEATVRVVARAGLRKVTNRVVAEEAGVTHGLVSHHFGTRDALVAEALKYVLDRSLAQSTLGSGSGSIDDLARTLVEMATSDADGQAFQKGYNLWVKDVNAKGGILGRPVKLTVLNDASNPTQAVTNYQTLINSDHVDLTFGPFSSLITTRTA